MTSNLFEYATRNKLRFASTKGELNIEQLWDIPLRSKDDFNLNTIAKAASKAWKEISEESFVESSKTPEYTKREMALETVKFIIEMKLLEEDTALIRTNKRLEKEKLLKILAEKQDGKLSDLTFLRWIASLRSGD